MAVAKVMKKFRKKYGFKKIIEMSTELRKNPLRVFLTSNRFF